MARERKTCKGHTEFFPQEPRSRYLFEFNKLPDICVRCQKAAIAEKRKKEKPTKSQVNFYMDPKSKAQLYAYARENGRAISSVFREAVDFYLLKYDK